MIIIGITSVIFVLNRGIDVDNNRNKRLILNDMLFLSDERISLKMIMKSNFSFV